MPKKLLDKSVDNPVENPVDNPVENNGISTYAAKRYASTWISTRLYR